MVARGEVCWYEDSRDEVELDSVIRVALSTQRITRPDAERMAAVCEALDTRPPANRRR